MNRYIYLSWRYSRMKQLFFPHVLFFILCSLITGCDSSSSKTMEAYVKDQPTIGNPDARVHVVVFEEPKCSGCKEFSTLVFPILKQDYIDTNKIRYTMLPVTFIPNSMPAAKAWMCVYNQDKDHPNGKLYFDYVAYTYAHQPDEGSDWAKPDTLIDYAKATSSDINIEALKKCLQTNAYEKQIEDNTNYGMKLMNGELSTPAIYVNGAPLEEASYDSLSATIDKALKRNN